MINRIIMLLLVFLLVWCSAEEYASFCPTWTHLLKTSSSDKPICVCGDRLKGVVDCDIGTLEVHLGPYYCISYSEELNTTIAGRCPYRSYESDIIKLPKKLSALNSFLCGDSHRRGQLCGQCEVNYSFPAYSYNLGCVKCKNFQYGWIKFIAVAFLPLTFFYILVIVFRISATSSALNGYVLVNQLVAVPVILRKLYSSNIHMNSLSATSYGTQYLIDVSIALYAVWNLDFFRSLYNPICLHPDLTTHQVLTLDYAIAVYPLMLIFITFTMVKLHDNFAFVVWLWRPFHKCLALFRKQWNIRSSLVNALATFITLSYIKILNVSFVLLIPSHVYNMEGQGINKVYLYYDGSVEMASREYLPYLLLATFMLLVFNVLPCVLLTIYPFRCFQKILNHCSLNPNHRLALQALMDAFQGCFKDTPHDYRHFAALYIALRFINPLLFIVLGYGLFLPIASLFLVTTLMLVIKFQPYKSKRSNLVDTVLLFSLVSLHLATLMYVIVYSQRLQQQFPCWLINMILIILGVIPPSYVVLLVMVKVFQTNCFKKTNRFVSQYINKIKTSINNEQILQELINNGGSNYQTF